MVNELEIEKVMEGSVHGLIEGTLPELSWRD
jgi:hypothetical protein